MTKLTSLIEAAKADIARAAKSDDYPDATVEVPAATILELCVLLEKAEGALGFINGCSYMGDIYGVASNALDAIKQWKEQT